MELFQKKKSLSSFQIIIFGFLAVILVGTLLLMLPFASREPGSAPFLDALFTATSATCVTGLIVHDTATYWSCFGQVVILLLIPNILQRNIARSLTRARMVSIIAFAAVLLVHLLLFSLG